MTTILPQTTAEASPRFRDGSVKLLLLALALLLTACASSRRTEGPNLALAAGWHWEILPAGAFDLAVATAPRSAGETLVVYLEGDGLAYARPDQPASDPTPSDPVALRMALADPAGTPTAWVGRPCQYTLPDRARNCATPYWTDRRYAPEVVDSIGAALDQLKLRSGASRLVLIGYSGGGAIATILAARRNDVVRLVTVAANLDIAYWTEHQGLAPLTGSLDPARDAAPLLGTVEQLHFAGAEDRTVGADVVRSFISRLPPGSPARLIEVPHYSHSCCWARDWPSLAAMGEWASPAAHGGRAVP